MKNAKKSTREPRVNHLIKVKEVRTIDEEGKQLGIIPTREALRLAQERGFDLVEVQPNQSPPVCKIMDYGKYKYDQKRKAKEAKKNQTIIEVKEMKFRPRIDVNDFKTKVGHIRRFINDGNKCRVVVMFRGREMVHTDLGKEILEDVAASLEDVATIEGTPKLEGRDMSMMLAPLKK